MGKSCLIVLIHGTFAPFASWTREGSKLRTTILNRLNPEIELQFMEFDWPGKPFRKFNNSHGRRLSAGKELEQAIAIENSLRPESKVILVGHSHGGNVALYALKGDMSINVAGIACISTPFIS